MTDPQPPPSGDLQPALPRPMYVDGQAFARERGGPATWGWPSRAGWPSSTSSGSRCW